MTFTVIVEERGFRRAAAKLGVSPSAISHSMRRLEARFGSPLLLRTTRSLAPTEAGALLLQGLMPAFAEIDRSLHELAQRSDQIAGLVRISAHRNAAKRLILPRLRGLLEEYPDLKVHLSVDDGVIDIVADGYDIGIRSGELLAKDMIAVRLSADYRSAVVAAPSYLQGRRLPQTPEDLQEHHCIAYRSVKSGIVYPWRFNKDGRQIEAALGSSLVIDDVDMGRHSALLGLGLGYVRHDTVSQYLRSGDLVEILPDWSIRISGDFLYYPDRRTLSPATRVIIDKLCCR